MTKAFIDTSVILRLLIKDDPAKARSCERLLREGEQRGLNLYLLPVAIMETVWVLEKIYKFERKIIREIIEAILNTPQLKIEMEGVFRNAIKSYEEKNIKFADALMGYWGLEKDLSVIFTYDEKDYKRIEGLEVRKP
jgi:predicted nucleic-acid-binding protein